MVIHRQGTVTLGFFILPADCKAWASSKSHLPWSWNSMYTLQAWPKGPYLWNWMGLLFLHWVSCKYTKHQHQVHSWIYVPHHNKSILQKFIWHLPMIPLFSLPQIWSRYHWCNLKACWGIVHFHWHLLFHEDCNPSCCRNHSHVIEEHEASPSLLEVSANTKFFDKENPFLSLISIHNAMRALH